MKSQYKKKWGSYFISRSHLYFLPFLVTSGYNVTLHHTILEHAYVSWFHSFVFLWFSCGFQIKHTLLWCVTREMYTHFVNIQYYNATLLSMDNDNNKVITMNIMYIFCSYKFTLNFNVIFITSGIACRTVSKPSKLVRDKPMFPWARN